MAMLGVELLGLWPGTGALRTQPWKGFLASDQGFNQ
jgi:hypothetical protein